jgi:hypothetical protein
MTFFTWSLSVFFYSFIELTALGEILMNLVRDLNVSLGIIAAFFLLMSGLVLSRGTTAALKKRNVFLVGMVALVLVILGIIDDKVIVVANGGQTTTGMIGIITIFFIPGISAITGIIFFIQARRDVENATIKKRISFFVLGSSLLVLGALVFGVGNVAFPGQEMIIVDLISEISWGTGPLAIAWGLYMVKTE